MKCRIVIPLACAAALLAGCATSSGGTPEKTQPQAESDGTAAKDAVSGFLFFLQVLGTAALGSLL
jgi:hypothetical protein